jgi:hypothetical protein
MPRENLLERGLPFVAKLDLALQSLHLFSAGHGEEIRPI